MRPLQLRLLNILTTFDQVCRERGLRYYLMAGTLLGAVRHQGFIPWDDDIDVGMPRADYNLLIAHAQEWLPQNYEMVCAENTPAYPFPFAKMQDAETTFIERRGFKHVGGIYVDVFPLDGVPSGKIARKRQFFQYKFWTKILYFTCRDPHKHGHDTSSLIPLLCRKLFTPAAIQKRIRKILTRYSFDQSVLIADYDDGIKGVMDKKILGNATPLSFEGKQLLGIEKYDEYLTQKYGDYMQIPEQGKQRQHGFYYLSLGKPYREYKGKG
ncbi:MAG: LicD family protein [Dysgonamonadaceae bacterium]|nr:LicD family protein [Dysgonamonadaceae bacterium]